MNLVFVTPFVRVPADAGIVIRNYQVLRQLAINHVVHLITWGEDETAETDRWLTERHISITRLSQAFGWARNAGRLARLQQMGRYPPIAFQRFAPIALADYLQHFLWRQPGIDLLVFDTALAGQALLYARLNKPCVLVLPDIYATLLRRNMVTIGLRPLGVVYLVEWLKTKLYETHVLGQYHHIVTVSLADCQWLARRFPSAEVTVSPNGVDTTFFRPVTRNGAAERLLFVAGFDYAPNIEAFFYFCREILPLIRRRRPTVHFVAAGRNPSSSMRAFAKDDPSITLTGIVSDVRPYYADAAVVVVPLRTGSGTKLKIIEAFAMGVPVVTTSVGLEGIAARDGEHVALADTPASFAEKVLWLLDQPGVAQAMAEQARQFIEVNHDWRMIVQQFDSHLSAILTARQG